MAVRGGWWRSRPHWAINNTGCPPVMQGRCRGQRRAAGHKEIAGFEGAKRAQAPSLFYPNLRISTNNRLGRKGGRGREWLVWKKAPFTPKSQKVAKGLSLSLGLGTEEDLKATCKTRSTWQPQKAAPILGTTSIHAPFLHTVRKGPLWATGTTGGSTITGGRRHNFRREC